MIVVVVVVVLDRDISCFGGDGCGCDGGGIGRDGGFLSNMVDFAKALVLKCG